MKTIVGLGNPGHTYHDTRHNVGFMVIQTLGERHGVEIRRQLLSPVENHPACVYGECSEGGESVRLMMPLTMMNESGQALTAAGVAVADVLLVCDDVNLPLGTLRGRPTGGAGGHHGLQSCLDALGTEAVARLRIGVGIQELPRDLHDFVLSSFQRAERPVIAQAITQAAEACELWVRKGIEAMMNQYNSNVQDAS